MDQLRKGIFLRSYGQIDPLREYKNEGHEMFEYMIDDIQVEVVSNLLRIRVERHEDIEIKEENTKLTTNDSKEHIARGPIRSSAREAKKARMEERKQRIIVQISISILNIRKIRTGEHIVITIPAISTTVYANQL